MKNRAAAAVAAILATICFVASPAVAGSYSGYDRFFAAADPNVWLHVGCGNWGLRLDLNSGGYDFRVRASNSTFDGTYPNCPNAYGLGAGASKTRPRGFWYNGSAWVLYVQPVSPASNGSGDAYVYQQVATSGVPSGYWYPRGGHDVTMFGTRHYYESGSDAPVDYYDNPSD